MKSTVKTISVTIDELRRMLAVTLESGDMRAADEVISKKISDKAERLERQREKRRLRAEQKKAEQKKSEGAAPAEACSNDLTMGLGRSVATSIVWLYNRRNHLKTNICCFLDTLSRGSNHPALKSIEAAIDKLIDLTEQVFVSAHQYLYLPACSRPTMAELTL